MKFENTEVFNFEGALRGMRNPMNSHNRSDSGYNYNCLNGCRSDCPGKVHENSCNDDLYCNNFTIGQNDMKLAQTLIKAGNEHRKFMRQIMVSVDITAPLYWWKECDVYKVGTTANSTSTMHKLATTPITLECFEIDDCYSELTFGNNDIIGEMFERHIADLEMLRLKYLETKDKRYWKELIRLLPESWLQTRTITMNYENVRNMYFQRKNHKLTEWSKSFVEWVEGLPYAKELIMYEG